MEPALVMEPAIREKIVVVWLGGKDIYWPTAREFNLMQDIPASQILFDSGVPLVVAPCNNVCSHLITTVHELKFYLEGKSELSQYLYEIVCDYQPEQKYGWSKVIWDVATTAWLVNPDWMHSHVIPSPILSDRLTWGSDPTRHPVRVGYHISRDAVLRDVFKKIAGDV